MKQGATGECAGPRATHLKTRKYPINWQQIPREMATMNPFDDIHHGAGAMQPAGINPFDAICIEERPTRISPPIPPRPVLTQCERPAPRRNPPQRRVQHPKPPPKPEPSAPPPPESLGLFEEAHTSVSVVSMDEEELNCPICFEMFCTVAPRVVYCCTCCKHSFCKPCIFDSLQRTGNTCPMCRNHMPQPARNFDLERTLANVPGFCKECGLSMPTSKLDEHESTCNGQHDNNNTANNNFWECQRCTFHNKLTEESCEMCLASNTTQQHTASNTPTTQQPIALHIPCATVVNQPAAQPRGQILLRVSSKKNISQVEAMLLFHRRVQNILSRHTHTKRYKKQRLQSHAYSLIHVPRKDHKN
uniref:RanBP-type and C3HC4-type zinc finger-containing protein 1 n=1 Tax=Mucochytrium quahogii TaxID=96639 RepID=A0A7S2RBV2_9STRA|mmetsp:Transcript_12548/g.26966  ORF Transcript_12548/g.26966 Transcript_12548/m.26966 type:complete len:360 (+) Transcript_12548:2-1081(+)